ncbi:hypothetical protein [Embleya sp. NBC_00896]|uniref:hypothetical protein n=1 Tax=Embleya sp. NBC_00896 TaxID=2975961 RepID=UPI0038638B36|nr:hypothetical protein OG928_34410 [Embleya sp. NBC_00896]
MDLRLTGWNRTQKEADAFVDVEPMEVDIDSVGFLAATPLLDLPPQAAAAYLGSFLRALMLSLHEQKVVGFFEDPLTRAHIITCLKDRRFWDEVIGPYLSGKRLEVLLEVIDYLVQERKDLALDAEDVRTLRARVSSFLQG